MGRVPGGSRRCQRRDRLPGKPGNAGGHIAVRDEWILPAIRGPLGLSGGYPSHWSGQERPGGATIYYCEEHGPHTVRRGNGVLYERLSGTASWLGFPKSDEEGSGSGRTIQSFEGGAIFYSPQYNSVPVRREALDYLARVDGGLGFPIRGPEPLASGDDDYIQRFEHGIITVLDGEIRAWVEAATSPE